MVSADLEEAATGEHIMSLSVTFQFMFQTFLIIIFGILFLGNVIPGMIFDSALFSNVSDETNAHKDAMWNWSIIIFVGAIAGNIIWYYRELQKEQSYVVDY